MPTPQTPELTPSPAATNRAVGASPGPSHGQHLQGVLDRQQQPSPRSPSNQGELRGNTYARLVDQYQATLNRSEFKGRVVAVLVAGASMTPQVNDEGKVELQTPETYLAKFKAVSADALVSESVRLAREPGKQNESVMLAMRAPLSRAFIAKSPEIAPDAVKANAELPMSQRHQGLNMVCPDGDERTGRPVLSSLSVPQDGGFITVFGFEQGRGASKKFATVTTSVDEKALDVVKVITGMTPVPATGQNGERAILRKVAPDQVLTFPAATDMDRRTFLVTMAHDGWKPITVPPHPRADLPEAARNLSAYDYTSRGVMALAQAVDQGAIQAGKALARNPEDESVLKRLDPLAAELAKDYANLVRRLEGSGLAPNGVDVLMTHMERPMKALAQLQREVKDVLAFHPDVPMNKDPITDIRILADGIIKAKGLDGAKLQTVRRLFDDAVGDAKAAGLEVPAAHLERMVVLNMLAKNLTNVLDAHTVDAGGERVHLFQARPDGTQAPIQFPDGTPRFATPFDQAITNGFEPYARVANAYNHLIKESLDAGATLTAIQLMTTAVPGRKVAPGEAEQLARSYINDGLNGPESAMKPQDRDLVEKLLDHSRKGSLGYLSEAVATHVFGAMATAHRERLSPAEVQRELVARARDMEPAGLRAQSYRVYTYNSVKESDDPGVYFVPEDKSLTSWKAYHVGLDEGLPVFKTLKNDMTYQAMTETRQALSFGNMPVAVSRVPLPKGSPTAEGIGMIFNKPMVILPDPIEGTPRHAVVLGLSVEAPNPRGTDVLGGRYNAILHSKGRMVPDAIVKIQADEVAFRIGNDPNEAKRLLGAKASPEALDTLDRLMNPAKGGAYQIPTSQDGFERYRATRGAAIQVMAEVMTAKAEQDYARNLKGLAPDQKADAETRHDQGIAKVGAMTASAQAGLDLWIERAQTFVRTHAGIEGYFSFDPPLGLGGGGMQLRDAPLDFRFRDVQDFVDRQPQLGRAGLGIRYDMVYGREA